MLNKTFNVQSYIETRDTISSYIDIPKIRGKIQKPELMPANFSEFRGQEKAKTLLKEMIDSALKENRALRHVLLKGLPGQGKTTLAWLISDYAKRKIVTVTSSGLDKPIDVYAIFKEVEKEKYPIIFIDEIHNLKKQLAELFYIPMENPGSEIVLPSTYGTLKLSIIVPELTIIGATAGEEGKIPKPMLDRFTLKILLEPYTSKDIEHIVKQSARKLNLDLPDDTILEIVNRSILTPRIANNFLRVIKDHIISNNIKNITKNTILEIFNLLNIDEFGLDPMARKILLAIAESPKGRLGLNSIASIVQTDINTVKLYETQLLTLKLIVYQNTGRTITEKGIEYLEHLDKNK